MPVVLLVLGKKPGEKQMRREYRYVRRRKCMSTSCRARKPECTFAGEMKRRAGRDRLRAACSIQLCTWRGLSASCLDTRGAARIEGVGAAEALAVEEVKTLLHTGAGAGGGVARGAAGLGAGGCGRKLGGNHSRQRKDAGKEGEGTHIVAASLKLFQ